MGYELREENAQTSVKISFLEYCQLFGRLVVDGGGEKFIETLAYSAAEQAQYPHSDRCADTHTGKDKGTPLSLTRPLTLLASSILCTPISRHKDPQQT